MRQAVQWGAGENRQGCATAQQQGDAPAARPAQRPAPQRRPWPFTVVATEQHDSYARLQRQGPRPVDPHNRQQQQAGSSQDL